MLLTVATCNAALADSFVVKDFVKAARAPFEQRTYSGKISSHSGSGSGSIRDVLKRGPIFMVWRFTVALLT